MAVGFQIQVPTRFPPVPIEKEGEWTPEPNWKF